MAKAKRSIKIKAKGNLLVEVFLVGGGLLAFVKGVEVVFPELFLVKTSLYALVISLKRHISAQQ